MGPSREEGAGVGLGLEIPEVETLKVVDWEVEVAVGAIMNIVRGTEGVKEW